jgi:hypothetical protein
VIYLILHGISWSLGTGDLVALGKDRILGIRDNSFLSTPLQETLKEKNIVTLAQARNPLNAPNLSDYWVNSIELGMEGILALEWDMFRRNLFDSGVILQEGFDQVMWMGGDNPGNPTARKFYLRIVSSKCLTKVESWRLSIWKWQIQLKVKMFIWLVIEEQILTWNMLQRKGWEGPGRCPLCKRDLEMPFHIFKLCPFSITVWKFLKHNLNLDGDWLGNTLSDCLKNWYMIKTMPTSIAAHVIWFTSLEHNKAIF